MNKPLVPGSFAAWGRTFFLKILIFFEHTTCPGQLRCLGQNLFSKNVLSGILGLLCAEQHVGNPNKWTFRNSGSPVRRTRRRKYQKWTFRNSVTPVRRTKRRKSKTTGLSGILGLLCAEQEVGNPKTLTFRNSGTHKTSEISKKCTFKN